MTNFLSIFSERPCWKYSKAMSTLASKKKKKKQKKFKKKIYWSLFICRLKQLELLSLHLHFMRSKSFISD